MKRLIAAFAACLLIASMAAPVMAAPTFTYTPDDQGANDEPGQKDLTAQSSASDGGDFFTSWKWDDLEWSGNNTGDGCSLLDTDDDDLTNYALCATVKGGKGAQTVSLVSFILYSCNDTRADRCAGPTALVSKIGADAATYCTVTDSGPGTFDALDTVIVCNLSDIAAEANPPIVVTGNGILLNTCSYPSREPNSDPSDCVLTVVPATPTTTSTTPTGSATFTATLNDSATVSPTAPGSVVFTLYKDDPATSGACNAAEQVYQSASIPLVAGTASTSTTTSTAGTYNWTVDFTPTDPTNFVASSSGCGSETVIVTAPSVS